MTKKLTREEAIRNFREHWASLAISKLADKQDYLKRHGFRNIVNGCFLCEYEVSINAASDCNDCPIEWPETRKGRSCPCNRSYYGDWREAESSEERSRLAAVIRDLPEKKEKPKPGFQVGDWVKVLSGGGCHKAYKKFFGQNNFNEFAGKFKSGESPTIGDTYKIVGIGKFKFNEKIDSSFGPLYVIESCDGQIYIMNNAEKGMILTAAPILKSKVDNKAAVEPEKEVEHDAKQFKVGDRVRYIGQAAVLTDKTGTVIGLDYPSAPSNACVEFDEYVDGHAVVGIGETEGLGKPGHCWWCYLKHLVLAPNSSESKSQLSKPAINPLVEKTVAEWVQLLNIADWKIELKFVTPEEMAEIAETGDCIVDCIKDRVKKHAEICVNFECDEIQEGDDWKSLLASTLISIAFDELMFHTDCLVDVVPEGIRDTMSEQLDVYYERTVNNLANGFLAALNKPPRS